MRKLLFCTWIDGDGERSPGDNENSFAAIPQNAASSTLEVAKAD
jgi:hypothetical protein